MAGAAKKQDFDAIYRQPNPLAFRKDIMESLSYVCDDFTRQEFDRLLLPLIPQLKQPCNVVDLLCCFGNTTMAIVNGMSVEEIHQNWSDEASCKTVARPRRFPCNITGVDISQSALDYTTSSGINDASICADMNTSAGAASDVYHPLPNLPIKEAAHPRGGGGCRPGPDPKGAPAPPPLYRPQNGCMGQWILWAPEALEILV